MSSTWQSHKVNAAPLTRVPLVLFLLTAPAWSARGGEEVSSAKRGSERTAATSGHQRALAEVDAEHLNPVTGDDHAVRAGGLLFRQLCVGCHGTRGRGGKGPDLTDTRWLHGSGDEALFRVIQRGVGGTTMKQLGGSISPEQIWQIIAFVRTLARSVGDPDWRPYLQGDPVAGRTLFFDGKAECARCHAVDGKGGKIGPPLSRIAAQRSPKYVMESLLQPSADINPTYEAVMVGTRRGRVITGVRINEDNFSIQMRDQETGRLHTFFKRELEAVQKQDKSLMPDNLAEQLTIKELHDLFAYLMTLDGQISSASNVAGTRRGAGAGDRRTTHAQSQLP